MKVKKVLNRVYVHDIDQAVDFYEKLLNTQCTMRFNYHQVNLGLAQVGDILIIAGSDDALKPFVNTRATFLVDSLIEYKDFLFKNGAVMIRDITEVPTGLNMTVKHFDGTIIEYVEHHNESGGGSNENLRI